MSYRNFIAAVVLVTLAQAGCTGLGHRRPDPPPPPAIRVLPADPTPAPLPPRTLPAEPDRATPGGVIPGGYRSNRPSRTIPASLQTPGQER